MTRQHGRECRHEQDGRRVRLKLGFFRLDADAGGAQSGAVAYVARASGVTKKPDFWGLYEYVIVSHQNEWIDDETRGLLLAVKNFRNLIHADRAVRTKGACDCDTAHIAYGCAHRLIKQFSSMP